MTTVGAHAGEDRHVVLLELVVSRLRGRLPVADLLGPGLDVARVIELLGPIGRAGAVIESIASNDARIDAVVTAGEAQWRVVFGSNPPTDVIDWLDVYERPDRFDGIPGGSAIVVNGPSGAGKSTLMRALQQVATFPLLVLDEPEHIGTVQAGYLIWRDRAPSLHRGYLEAIGALGRADNCIARCPPGLGLRP